MQSRLKNAIEKSVKPLREEVNKPGDYNSTEQTSMSELSKSGGFVNADAAVEYAATLKPDKKEKGRIKTKAAYRII